MKETDYVKTLLYSYSKLSELAEAVGSGAEVKAMLSFRGKEDALLLAERIAEEIVMSKKLSLLKEELDGALSGLSERENFLLEYKYFRRKKLLKGKYRDFILNCSERSYFRMQNALLQKIAFRLLSVGLTRERFLSEFKDFPPFMRVLRALSEGKDRVVVTNRRRRALKFQNSGDSCGSDGFLPLSRKTAIAESATPAAQMIAIWTPESPLSGAGSSAVPPDCSTR